MINLIQKYQEEVNRLDNVISDAISGIRSLRRGGEQPMTREEFYVIKSAADNKRQCLIQVISDLGDELIA